MTAFKKVKNKKYPYSQSKCNQKAIDAICNNLRLGAYLETAAVVAGISKKTFYNWCKYGNDEIKANDLLLLEDPKAKIKTTIHQKLLHSVERAQEESEVRDLQNIDRAAMGAKRTYERDNNGKLILDDNNKPILLQESQTPLWTASAWRLERKNPNKWGRTEHINAKVNDGSIHIHFTDEPEEDETNK